jgi:hypothetical protein
VSGPAAIEAAILALLVQRRPGATVCPSEVARRLAPETARWRALMPEVRAAAGRLAAAGRITMTQRGRAVDPGRARGPIRLRLPDPPG